MEFNTVARRIGLRALAIMIKKCVECGAEFSAPPSSKKITCSTECKKKRRSRLLTGHKVSDATKAKISSYAKTQGYTDNLRKGAATTKTSEKAGRSEKNSSAKTFLLVSPDRRQFEVTNLRHWVRNHIDMFDGDGTDKNVDRICHGFYTIKRNIKNNFRGQTYKGWTLYGWDDRKNFEKNK